MRVSTQTIFNQSARAINRQQSRLLHVGQQIASNRRVLSPSDDPQAASRAVQVSHAQAVTSQYTDTRVAARNALSMEESVLGSVGDAVTSAKTLILEAANGTLSDADRASIASQLKGVFNTVLGQANATDGNGRYLFGGYKNDSAPFVEKDGEVKFVGSTDTRHEQIDATRSMSVEDDGATVFQSDTPDDLFASFTQALEVLKQPADTADAKTALQDTLGDLMNRFDNSLDNVLTVRASVGSRLNELDAIDKVADARKVSYAQTKSNLVDLDYTAAASEYSLRMVGLKAAQQAFMSMKQMNLFNLS
jgi:flagellin-like hook-associated protein FlgL